MTTATGGTEVRLGIYRHFKGGLYEVIGLAQDANADTLYRSALGPDHPAAAIVSKVQLGERVVVVYRTVPFDVARLGPLGLFMDVRTLDHFASQAEVPWFTRYCPDPSACGGGNHVCIGHKSNQVQRFTYLGPVLTADMLAAHTATHGGQA